MNTLPFTADQFFDVFARYNASVWPWQFVLATVAAALSILAWRRPESAARAVPFFLAILWMWSGVAYHFAHFSRINPAAWIFGGLFVVQGMLWVWAGRYRRLAFVTHRGAVWTVGAVGITYALVIYPLLGTLLGHGYPSAPTFGAPCPSTIFTFAILLWTAGSVPVRLVVIPFLWALLAAPAAIGWGVLEDVGMPLMAVVTVILLAFRNRQRHHSANAPMAGAAAALRRGRVMARRWWWALTGTVRPSAKRPARGRSGAARAGRAAPSPR